MNYEEWYKSMPSLGMSEEAVAGVAWRACKEEVLKILKKDWTGLDLSINSCDNHYIEKVEKL